MYTRVAAICVSKVVHAGVHGVMICKQVGSRRLAMSAGMGLFDEYAIMCVFLVAQVGQCFESLAGRPVFNTVSVRSRCWNGVQAYVYVWSSQSGALV